MKENRISQRVSIELPAKFYFEGHSKSLFKGTVVNISIRGFCFRTKAEYYEAFSSYPVIRLVLEIAKKENLEFDVKVAWVGRTSSANCLVGGEIINSVGPDYLRILNLYKKHSQSQPEGGE